MIWGKLCLAQPLAQCASTVAHGRAMEMLRVAECLLQSCIWGFVSYAMEWS